MSNDTSRLLPTPLGRLQRATPLAHQIIAGATAHSGGAAIESSPDRVFSATVSHASNRPVTAEARALAEFGDSYRRILEEIGSPGYRSMKALFFGEDGPPGDTVPSITVSFELFEAVQNRFATTKATLERTREDLHTRHQQYAELEGQHEQLQESYRLQELRVGELERKNTQLHQDMAKQDVMAELLRQQVARMESEMEMIGEKMAKRDEELQVLHNRVAEGLVALSQKETIIANLRRQLGYGGLVKYEGGAGRAADGEEYSPEALKRIADDVEGRSAEARLRLLAVELEAQVRTVMDEKKHIMLRHTMYRRHVQDVTEAYEGLCMSREDAMRSHVCEAPPPPPAMPAPTEGGDVYVGNKAAENIQKRLSNESRRSTHGNVGPLPSSAVEPRKSQCGSGGDESNNKNGISIGNEDELPMSDFYDARASLRPTESEGQMRRSTPGQSAGSSAEARPVQSSGLQSNRDSKMRSSNASSAAAGRGVGTNDTSTRSDVSKKTGKLVPERHSVSSTPPDSSHRANVRVSRESSAAPLEGPRSRVGTASSNRSSNTTSMMAQKEKSAGVRDEGTRADRLGSRQSIQSGPFSTSSPMQKGEEWHPSGAHNRSPASSFSLVAPAVRSEDEAPSRPASSAPSSERDDVELRRDSGAGSFGKLLPTFGHERSVMELNNKRPSENVSHADRAKQEKDGAGTGGVERTRSATNRATRILARKYADLHTAITDIDELLFPPGENERVDRSKPTTFFADECSEDAATQSAYISNAVVTDTQMLLRVIHRLHRLMSATSNSQMKQRSSLIQQATHDGRKASMSISIPNSVTEVRQYVSKSKQNHPLDTYCQGASAAGPAAQSLLLGKETSNRPDALEKVNNISEKVHASEKIHRPEKPNAARRLDSSGKSDAAEKPRPAKKTDASGNAIKRATDNTAISGEVDTLKGGKSSSGSTPGIDVVEKTSLHASKVEKTDDAVHVEATTSTVSEQRGSRKDQSLSVKPLVPGPSTITTPVAEEESEEDDKNKNNINKPNTVQQSFQSDMGVSTEHHNHVPQPPAGERKPSGSREVSRTSPLLILTSQKPLKQQKDQRTAFTPKKTIPSALSLPKVPVRGKDKVFRGQTAGQEGATSTPSLLPSPTTTATTATTTTTTAAINANAAGTGTTTTTPVTNTTGRLSMGAGSGFNTSAGFPAYLHGTPAGAPARAGGGGGSGALSSSAELGTSAFAGPAVAGNVPVLPGIPARPLSLASISGRLRQGPERLPWRPAVIRIDLATLLGDPGSGQASGGQYQNKNQQQQQQQYFSQPLTRANAIPWTTLLSSTRSKKSTRGRNPSPASRGGTSLGFGFYTKTPVGRPNAFPFVPTYIASPPFNWEGYMPGANTAGHNANANAFVGGRTLVTLSNPVSSPHSKFSPHSILPQTPQGSSQKAPGQVMPTNNAWRDYHSLQPRQPDLSDFTLCGQGLSSPHTVHGGNYGNANVHASPFVSPILRAPFMAHVIRQRSMFWRHRNSNYYRGPYRPPMTFSQAWTKRKVLRNRQRRLSSESHLTYFNRIHPQWVQMAHFQHQKNEPPLDLQITSVRCYKASRKLERERYVKRLPRSSSLVKRLPVTSTQLDVLPEKEFVPILIQSLSGRPYSKSEEGK